MELDQITPAAALTVSGASILVAIIVGAILSAWKPTPDDKDRFGPLLALVVAVILVGGLAIAQGADVIAAVLVGIVAGGGSMGVHDVSGALGGP